MPPQSSAPIEIAWPPAPAASPVTNELVQAWAVSLNPEARVLSECSRVLAPDELERAAAFKMDWLQRRFIAGRGQLRAVLASCLDASAREIELASGPNGKPLLAGRFAQSGLHFNLAHSHDLALIAVTLAGPVGVDVEFVRPIDDCEGLVRRFFSMRESAQFAEVEEARRAEAFMNLWTRKEALLKSTGEGITRRLSQVEVTFLPGEAARVLAVDGDEEVAAEWTLMSFEPARGFVGALAIRLREPRLECWRWQ